MESKGRPKLSFLAQVLHLIVLVPTIVVSSKYGFWPLVLARSWIRMQFVLVHLILMKFAIGIPILKTVKNVIPTFSSAIAMGFVGYFLQQIKEGILWDLLSIIICMIFYFGILFIIPSMRSELTKLISKFLPKKILNKFRFNH